MKKLLINFISILVLCNAYSQDTVVLEHQFYRSTFIKSKHIPLLVEYTLTEEMLSCKKKNKRKNSFSSDPLLPEVTSVDDSYKRTGYDRGHNMSAEDNSCSKKGMEESFYFSNIFPQNKKLNRGVWKKLENAERTKAKNNGKIKVFIGNYGVLKKIGKDSIAVPQFCWKVFYYENSNTYECYSFPNKKPTKSDVMFYTISLAEIEQKCKIVFKKDKVLIN
jgi:endonuclease G